MKYRKFLAILLALIMVIGLLPFAALADDGQDDQPGYTQGTDPTGDGNPEPQPEPEPEPEPEPDLVPGRKNDSEIALLSDEHPNGTILTSETSGDVTEDTYFYLAENVTSTNTISAVGCNVTICLHGNTLSGAILKTIDDGTLTICDCVGSGCITRQNAIQLQGGTLNVLGGEINGQSQFAIKADSGATVNIVDGSIVATESNPAIYMKGGELHVSGGSIGGGARYAIQLENSASLYLSGNPVIEGTDKGFAIGSEVYLNGIGISNAIKNSIYAADNGKDYSGKNISIALSFSNVGFDKDDVDVTLVRDASERNYQLFSLNSTTYTQKLDYDVGGQRVTYGTAIQTVPPAPSHTHAVDGTGETGQTWQPWDHNTNVNGLASGYYYLTENITLESDIAYTANNADVHICLNGHSITSSNTGGALMVGNGASVSICDCQGEGTIVGEGLGTIVVNPGATLDFYSGTITNNYGSGIVIALLQSENEETVANMYGGTIDVAKIGIGNGGGIVNVYGGNIYYDNYAGVFNSDARSVATIKGGMIAPRNNPTRGDNGVYVSKGTLYLTGAADISGVSGDIKMNNPNAVYASKENAEYSGGELSVYYAGSATTEGPIILSVTGDNAGKFTLVSPADKILKLEGNNLILGTETVGHPDHGADGTGTTTETWQVWNPKETPTISKDGYYYLNADYGFINSTITIDADVHLCLNGHLLKDNQNKSDFIVIKDGASLTICDCDEEGEGVLDYYTSGDSGYAIKNSGDLTLYSGKINSMYAGGVWLPASATGTFTMAGGTIDVGGTGISNGGSASRVVMQNGTVIYGGEYGIFSSSRGSTAISGGTIQPREDNSTGSGFYVGQYASTVLISAGTIIGNEYGVYIPDMYGTGTASYTISGGTITAKNGYGVGIDSGETVSLIGSPNITGTTADLYIKNPNVVKVTKESTSYTGNELRVYFGGDADETEPIILDVTEATAGKFTLVSPEDKILKLEEDNLILGTETLGHPNHSADGEGLLPEGAEWIAWDGETDFLHAFPANSEDTSDLYVYLTADVAYSKVNEFVDIAPNNYAGIMRNVHLCLNGHTISGVADGVIAVKGNTSLTICDCDEQARGTIQNTSTTSGYAVIQASGNVTLYSGNLVGNGEGVDLIYSPAVTFRMEGGSIETGSTAIRAGNRDGGVEIVGGEIQYGGTGGIFISDGTVHVSGGTIAPKADNSNNSAAGIEFTWNSSGKLYLTDAPSITGKGAALSIAKPNTVYASKDGQGYSGDPLTVAFTGNGDDVPIILDVTDNNFGKFTLVSPTNKSLVRQDNNLVLTSEPAGHQAHDADGTGSIPEGKEWIAWDGSTQMNAPGYYYLDKDVTLTSTIKVTADVHLCLNGHKMSDNGENAEFIIVNRDASLTICDCSDETGTINYNCKTGYAIDNKGALTLYSGKIYSDHGNGIQIMSNGGSDVKFYMEGGTIDVGGIGILFSIGNEVNIKDGTLIYGGQTGVLFGAKGTLTVSGGTIQPRENGDKESRGISKTGTGDLFVTGGNISGKENGIRVISSKSGAVTISGGNISASGEKGYGIYLYETATANLYLSDAPTISGQKADLYIGKPNTVYAGKETAAYNGSALDIYYAGDAATVDPIILNVTADKANLFNLNYPTNKTLEHRGDNLYLADKILPMPALTVTVDSTPLTYGQEAQATVSGAPSGVDVTYTYSIMNGNGIATINEQTGEITATGIGTFRVKVVASADGYENGEATSAVITVIKATPTPEEVPSVLTATYGHTLADIALPDGWTWKNPETSVGNVGTHEFEAIYQETPEEYYNSVPMKLPVEVTPKSISGASIELGASLTYTGEELTQTVASVTLDGVALDPKDYTLTNNKATDVGTYTLTITGTGNYNGTVTKQWSIAKAVPTVTAPTAKTGLVYNGAAQELVTAGTAAGGTMVYSLEKEGEYTTELPQEINAGDYTVWYKVEGDENHSDTTPRSINVSIGKANLTVTADNKQIYEGSPAPTYTATYSGFVNGETEADLSGELTFTCSYTQDRNPGTYDIKPSGLTSDNYAITFQNGTLTVVAVGEILPPVAKNLTYTGKAQKLIDPATAADDVDLFYSLDGSHFNSTIPEAKNAGTYKVYWKAEKGGTTVDSGSLDVTIKKAALTVTADDTWVYAGDTPKFTATIKGYVNGEDWRVLGGKLTFTCGYSEKYSKPGSRYTITPKGLTADNYEITFKTGTLTVYDPLSPRFNVYVLESKHGTVEADCRYARKGDVVTLTIKPDWGYELETLTVTDSHGYALKLTYHNNGTYTFTMPRDNVTVKAVFTVRDMPFVDVPGDAWYAGGVRYVYAHGLMNGTGSWRFSPNLTTTRAMIATILYRMEGSPRVYGSSQFTDVKAGSWYEDAVIWATQNDIVEGYTSKSFGPNDPITREQMAAMFYRYADYCRCDMSAGRYIDLSKYSDMNEISAYAIPALRWAVGEEIIQGRTGKRLAPTDTATRAEVAMMLMRFCEDVIW